MRFLAEGGKFLSVLLQDFSTIFILRKCKNMKIADI